ncbi:hypothetical protein H072_8386 [Dactylellina haptotyla CBS 200.50]|uniref:Uncharacterized protein n=1 Tax=Dactylellina haptotyla (strain CBS 200.50) TaxID=1284197 RepID=S8BRU9_DACHA|nr:hypothetical protein H072_8386 [Dactylellina haptotyla CBS 200.50]
MKSLLLFVAFTLVLLISPLFAQDFPFIIWKRDGYDETLSTGTSITSTASFDDIDTSHSVSKPTDVLNEEFIEPTDSVPKSNSTSQSKSPNSSGKTKSSSSSSLSSTPPPQPTTTTTHAYYKKVVKLHVESTPATAAGYPVKPTAAPTFAYYDEGIVYIKGTPYQVLAADSDYYNVEQGGNGDWELVDKVDTGKGDDKNKTGQLEQNTNALLEDGDGKGKSGSAVYSADVVSAAENAVRKAAFFSFVAAGMITIGLLVFFGIIKT